MSGTSIDGVDAALVSFDHDTRATVLSTSSVAFPPALRQEYLQLQSPSHNEIHRERLAANALALLYNDAIARLLESCSITAAQIVAVGAHGQTIRHVPPPSRALCSSAAFTIQSLNGALLAESCGIDVVCDFRSRDVAAGGQGAPLVPAFHLSQFAAAEGCAVLNIGGIANFTFIPPKEDSSFSSKFVGFDTGPGNVLMDLWVARHWNCAYDDNGSLASKGRVVPNLLDAMLQHEYFSRPAPKSTGRDLFNEAWLDAQLSGLEVAATGTCNAPQDHDHVLQQRLDVLATLLALTARSIALHLQHAQFTVTQVIVCGGGVRNAQLMQQLRHLCNCPVMYWPPTCRSLKPTSSLLFSSSDCVGVDPQAVEAMAFAWLAHAHCSRTPGNVPAVTGALGPRILGCMHPK